MPKKWQIFKIVSLVQLGFTLIMLGTFCYRSFFENNNLNQSNTQIVTGAMLLISLLSFDFFCLQLILKFYPGNEIKNPFNVAFMISCMLAIVMSLLFALGIAATIITYLKLNNTIPFRNTLIVTLFFIPYLCILIYKIINSLKLRNIIKSNFIITQSNIINSLGSK
jgi:hypothetical protein